MNNTEKLHQAFIKGLSIDISLINEDLAYQEIAEWDSMSHMFLIAALEEAFHINIETEDILEMSNYPRIIEILKNYNIIL